VATDLLHATGCRPPSAGGAISTTFQNSQSLDPVAHPSDLATQERCFAADWLT
jgi:hypothetical protein